MSLNQLMQFENMDDVQRIQVIGSILMANGAKRIVRYQTDDEIVYIPKEVAELC